MLDQINKKILDILSSVLEEERKQKIGEYLTSLTKDKSKSHLLFRKYIKKNPLEYIEFYNNQL